MSNKHDNIYNILGKLNALQSSEAAVESAPAKPVNESVEARGSVLAGVTRVEARLAEMFNQPEMDEEYVACIVQHNRSGQPMVQRTKPISRDRAEEVIKHALSKNTFVHPPFMTIYPASAGKLDGSAIMAQFPDMSQEGMNEATAPVDYEKVLEAIAALYGDDMWDNDAMGDLAQDLEQAGPTDRELDFIIAKGKLPRRLKGIRFTNTDDVQFGHLGEESDWSNLGAEYRSTKPGTKEPTHTGEKEYVKGGVKHRKDFDREVSHQDATGEKRGRGRPKKSQFEEGQLDELSVDTLNSYADKAKGQRNHAFGRMTAAQQGNRAADPTGKFAKTWDKRATGYDQAVAKGATDLDKSGTRSTWNYDQDMEEGMFDAFHSTPQHGFVPGDTVWRGDKKATLVKLDRSNNTVVVQDESGRQAVWPVDKTTAQASGPMGKMGQQYRGIKSKLGMRESINFAEMMKEQHQTVDEYLMELQADIAEFKKSGRMSEKLRDSMEMHKFSKKQVTDEVRGEVKGPSFAPQFPATPAPAKPPGMLQRAGSAIAGGINKVVGHGSDAEMLNKLKHDSMDHDLNELARLAGLSEGLKGGQKKLDKNKNGKLDSDDFKRLRDKVDEATVDEDYLKDKKADKDYDGDGEVETGSEEHAGSVDKAIKKAKVDEAKPDFLDMDKDGNKKEPMKKAIKDKKKVDECGMPGSMSPFSSTGQEEETGMSINSSMDTKTGRKTLSVTADGEAAEQLAQMLKMAGMGGSEAHGQAEHRALIIQAGPEEAVEEEREDQYANTPEEEVENIDSILHQGNDLNREKEQYSTDRGRDNPMAMHRESIEMPASLSRMIEGIKMVEAKKCNHSDKGEKCPVHGIKECGNMYEAAKWRDPEYKDKLYTQEPETDADTSLDSYYDRVKPDDYQGAKRLKSGGEFDNNDPLQKGYGRSGTGSMNTHGKRKGMPSRSHISSLKGSIKDAHGTHPSPNLPESKPSAGMSKGEKSSLVKKAKSGGDIGKPGKSFDKVAKSAGGGEKGKYIAAAAMWKNAAKK